MSSRSSRLSLLAATCVAGVLVGCGTPAEAPPSVTPTNGSAPSSTAGSSPSAGGRSPSAGTGSSDGSPDSASPSSSPTASGKGTPSPSSTSGPATACLKLASSLSLKDQVGQLFMVGIGSEGLGSSEAEVLKNTRAGSVILLGNTEIGVDRVHDVTEQVRSAIDTPKGVRVMLTADQEGGQVQRLKGEGFRSMPSAERQADLSDAELKADAESWGRELRKAGIDADLAPVADVVPTSVGNANAPIGALNRGYGPKPKVVSSKVTAFTEGMAAAGVATSVKHFPGLGRVRGNTDFAANVIDDSTTRDDPDLRPFAAGVKAGVDMVMVSSATYTKIDQDHAGPFSKIIMEEMIRQDLGFTGVVISDDLAGRAVSELPPGKRAVAFFRAGGDLAIMGDPSQAEAMTKAVRQRATKDEDFAGAVTEKTARVLQMKADRGLTDCG